MYQVLADYEYELNHLVQDEYVITPIRDIEGKTTYWVSKKGYMYAIYLKTDTGETKNFKYYEDMFKEAINLYESFLKNNLR